MGMSTQANAVLWAVGLSVSAPWLNVAGASPMPHSAPHHSGRREAAPATHHYPYTVMYRIIGDALAGDVWYTNAQGVTVYVPYASFPWKQYLHPEKGARLFLMANMGRAYPGMDIETPGVTAEIWVNGKRIGAGVSDGDPRCSAQSEFILGK